MRESGNEVGRYNKDDGKGIFGLEYPFFVVLISGEYLLVSFLFLNLFHLLAVGDITTHGNCRLIIISSHIL